jgi:hypothetical protein
MERGLAVVSSSLRKRIGRCALAVAALCCFSPATFAALLVEFKTLPISPSDPEVKWTPSGLIAAPQANGSQGNGDGTLPIGSQTVGGLIIETPVTINRPDLATLGGSINAGNNNSTTFSDVTLQLANFNSSGPAAEFNGLLDQPLGPGFVRLQSTNTANGPVDLLVGTIGSADITGIKNSDTGSVLSGNVTYTGGLIADALNAALGHAIGTPIPGGSLSFSLLDIDNKLNITGSGATARLGEFSANATGQFGTPVVPEPASLSLLALGACGILIRRRK